MALQKDAMEYFTWTLKAFPFGLIIALLLGALAGAMSGFFILYLAILFFALIWAVPKLPKQFDTLPEMLILVVGLLIVQGFLGMVLPGIAQLQWVSLLRGDAIFLTLFPTAIIALALVEKYWS